MTPTLKILIIEPNVQLVSPYSLITAQTQTQRATTVESAIALLNSFQPDIVFLSTSFALTKSLRFLEALKNFSTHKLAPLIFVIDLSNKVSHVPGTTWGGKIGILHSLSSKKEFDSTIHRVLES